MTADTLRRAASLMRERAEAATPGRWWPFMAPESKGSDRGEWIVDSEPALVCSTQYDDARNSADAAHIASWHPAVAFAVAAWLEQQARLEDIAKKYGKQGMSEDSPALAVARAYLGESS